MDFELPAGQEREENEDYVPCDSPMDAQSFVRNRLIDADEEDDVRIHYAVVFDDIKTLQTLLEEEGAKKWLDYRVRPFLATPLRLAATIGSKRCVSILLKGGAAVDLEDIKGQTPLFISTSERKLSIMEELLKYGAHPEGSILNRGTPLLIAVRDGFAEGVELLLRYGACSEPFNQINTCVPGWPLHHSVVYAHFSTFLALIRGGAVPNLKDIYSLSPIMLRRLSVPHAILKYASEKSEFVRLYYECGGDFSDVGVNDLDNIGTSPSAKEIKRLQRTPRTLKSLCRPRLLQIVGKKIAIQELDIPKSLHSFLRYEEYNIYAAKTKQNTHLKLISEE